MLGSKSPLSKTSKIYRSTFNDFPTLRIEVEIITPQAEALCHHSLEPSPSVRRRFKSSAWGGRMISAWQGSGQPTSIAQILDASWLRLLVPVPCPLVPPNLAPGPPSLALEIPQVTRKIGACAVHVVLFKRTALGGSASYVMRREPRPANGNRSLRCRGVKGFPP